MASDFALYGNIVGHLLKAKKGKIAAQQCRIEYAERGEIAALAYFIFIYLHKYMSVRAFFWLTLEICDT